MAFKNLKQVESMQSNRLAPIASARFSQATLSALKQSAQRLKEEPPRAFSKREIEQFFKKI